MSAVASATATATTSAISAPTMVATAPRLDPMRRMSAISRARNRSDSEITSTKKAAVESATMTKNAFNPSRARSTMPSTVRTTSMGWTACTDLLERVVAEQQVVRLAVARQHQDRGERRRAGLAVHVEAVAVGVVDLLEQEERGGRLDVLAGGRRRIDRLLAGHLGVAVEEPVERPRGLDVGEERFVVGPAAGREDPDHVEQQRVAAGDVVEVLQVGADGIADAQAHPARHLRAGHHLAEQRRQTSGRRLEPARFEVLEPGADDRRARRAVRDVERHAQAVAGAAHPVELARADRLAHLAAEVERARA